MCALLVLETRCTRLTLRDWTRAFNVQRSAAKQFVDDGQYAGVSLLLVRNGEIADTFAIGFRNLEIGLPMTRDTIVRVYSMTKIVVSVAALTLLEEGKLGLLDPVTDYLPEFRDLRVLVGGTAEEPRLVSADKPLSIQHLFTHTSGLIYEAPDKPQPASPADMFLPTPSHQDKFSGPLIEYFSRLRQSLLNGGLARNECRELVKIWRYKFTILDKTGDRPDGFVE